MQMAPSWLGTFRRTGRCQPQGNRGPITASLGPELWVRSSGSGALGPELWVRSFDTVEELRAALLAFRDTYNATWLIERHGFRPPNAVRQDQISTAALAA